VTEKKNSSDLLNLAENLISYGKKCGADEMEASIGESTEFDVDVRLGEIENLIEAGSRQVGFRIIKDKKSAFASSSDLSQETLYHLIENSLRRAELANPDEYAGLPDYKENKIDVPSLELYDPEIRELEPRKKINLAKETEKISFQDKRITNSHGANFASRELNTILVNSKGFSGNYRESVFSLGVGLQAGDTDNLVEDYWYCSKRKFRDLDTPEKIAKKAVERTIRQINPKKITTQNVPVIFEPQMTSWLLAFLFSCVSGVSIYQKASFLVDKLGEKIGNDNITVFDNGLMPGKLGTFPFDSEGEQARETIVIEKGVLKNYLCHTYSGKKLKLSSTGNASGAGVGPSNFFLQNGTIPLEKIISSLDKGLILIKTIGHGLNPITGDISRGAFGLWVEKGEIAYPVSEITISGNLGRILKSIKKIGNDLELKGSFSGPTIEIQEMTVAGT
jgi:PmbA protein